MCLVDYLSREPNNESRPKLELDEKFLVTSMESFHKALDYLSSRLNETGGLDWNEIIIKHFKSKISDNNLAVAWQLKSSKRTGLDRNESDPSSRFSKLQPGNLCNYSHSVQLFGRISENLHRKVGAG